MFSDVFNICFFVYAKSVFPQNVCSEVEGSNNPLIAGIVDLGKDCDSNNFIIKPNQKYRWVSEGHNVEIGEHGVFNTNENSDNWLVLSKIHFRIKKGYAIENFNKKLKKSKNRIVKKYNDIYSIRFFGGDIKIHDAYVFLDDKKPEYIIFCFNHCAYQEPVVIDVEIN